MYCHLYAVSGSMGSGKGEIFNGKFRKEGERKNERKHYPEHLNNGKQCDRESLVGVWSSI